MVFSGPRFNTQCNKFDLISAFGHVWKERLTVHFLMNKVLFTIHDLSRRFYNNNCILFVSIVSGLRVYSFKVKN